MKSVKKRTHVPHDALHLSCNPVDIDSMLFPAPKGSNTHPQNQDAL